MEVFELVLALLGSSSNCVNGRTTLQKLGYFASVMLRKDVNYEPDFYGPFSPSVANSLQSLVETDFVLERGRRTSRNRIMYSYNLTEDGLTLTKEIKEDYPKEYTKIRDIVRKCNKIVHCNYHVLSWAAKVHFVLEQNGKPMTYEEAIQTSKSFGWKLNNAEIESAVNLLQALKLIEKE